MNCPNCGEEINLNDDKNNEKNNKNNDWSKYIGLILIFILVILGLIYFSSVFLTGLEGL